MLTDMNLEFFHFRFVSRRTRKAKQYNIYLSLIKNIPYIVVVDKIKYYNLQQNIM